MAAISWPVDRKGSSRGVNPGRGRRACRLAGGFETGTVLINVRGNGPGWPQKENQEMPWRGRFFLCFLLVKKRLRRIPEDCCHPCFAERSLPTMAPTGPRMRLGCGLVDLSYTCFPGAGSPGAESSSQSVSRRNDLPIISDGGNRRERSPSSPDPGKPI